MRVIVKMYTLKSKMQKRGVKCIDVSFENKCPSPDGRENPFVSRFLERDTKDLEGQRD
jgi:hypothetical protein